MPLRRLKQRGNRSAKAAESYAFLNPSNDIPHPPAAAVRQPAGQPK